MKALLAIAAALTCALAASTAGATVRQICGYVRYQDRADFNNVVVMSTLGTARNLPVVVKTVATTLSPAMLTTDSNGWFSFTADVPPSGTLTLTVSGSSYAMQFTGATPTWTKTGQITGTTAPIDLSYTVSANDNAVKLNILENITRTRAYVEARADDPNDAIPDGASRVKVEHPSSESNARYEPGTSTILVPGAVASRSCSDADFPCSCSSNGVSSCTQTSGWEDITMAHEYGHHLQLVLSGQTMAMDHMTDACEGYAQVQAWHEGFPTWLAIVATGHMNPVLGGLRFDADNPNCNDFVKPGYPVHPPSASMARYEDIWATLHDIDDGTPDDPMNGSNPAAGGGNVERLILRIFDNELDTPNHTPTIHDFHNAFVARAPYGKAHRDLDFIMVKNRTMFSPTPHALPDFAVGSLSVSPFEPTMNGAITLTFLFGSVNGQTYPGGVIGSSISVGGTLVAGPDLDSGLAYQTVSTTVTLPNGMSGNKVVGVSVGGAYPLSFTTESNYANNFTSKTISIAKPCGDGFCSAPETCQTCPLDCGACDEPYEPPDPPHPPCFVAGTPITMADGSTRPIESVRSGDSVLAYDVETGALAAGAVEATMVHPDTERLVIVNGRLTTTPEHPFFVDGRWVEAGDLSVGDALVAAGAADASPMIVPASVHSLEARSDRTTTYNFTVARYHDYFAGGVLVHNKLPVDP